MNLKIKKIYSVCLLSMRKNFYRSIDKNYPMYDEYSENEIIPRPIGCHDGQKKLLYSEIEFYTKLSKKHNLQDILVVYVGSGHGFHEPIIFDMFPELDFFFIDPVHYEFSHPLTENKNRFTYLQEYYTDKTYKKIKTNKKIAFICDMRDGESDEEIFVDMKSQQKWCIQLNPIAYLLKFRLPYPKAKFKYENFSYKLPTKNVEIENGTGFKFLKGKILIQIYSRIEGTESRLLHIRKSLEEKFKIVNYDIFKYNYNLYYFNLIERQLSFSYKDSAKLKNHLLGYNDSYESVCEYFLIYKYLKRKHKASLKNIVKFLFNIRQYFKNMITCPLIGYNKFIKSRDMTNFDGVDKIQSYINSLSLIRLYQIKTLGEVIQEKIKEIEEFKKSINHLDKNDKKILTKDEYNIQIEESSNMEKEFNNIFEIVERCSNIDYDKLWNEVLEKQKQVKQNYQVKQKFKIV